MNEIDFLPSVLILLTSSILVVIILHKLKTSPVLGYLIAGAIINAYELIKEPKYAHSLAEVGIVFLLFVIGLELSFDRLIKMRLHVFGFGGLQVLITSCVIASVLYNVFYFSMSISVVLGATLALSSTAIVLQVITESGRQSSQVGRLSLSVLLMQDLAVVPLLAVIPLLADKNEKIMQIIGLSSLKALGVIILITIFGRLFLRPFFSLVASVKTDEVYVTTALLIVLGTAWLTSILGLSYAMGAFIAGILIAETEYRNRVENSIHPFQGLFLGLFFLSVGMSIDIEFIKAKFKIVILAALLLIFIKIIIIIIISKIFFRFRWGTTIYSALLLSQGSEFAFILFNIAAKKGILDARIAEFMLMAVALSMGVTPLLSTIGSKIEGKIDSNMELDNNQEFKGISDLNNHVIVAGFGKVGKVVAYMLNKEQIGHIVIESNARIVTKAKKQGVSVFQGEVSDSNILQALGIKRAKAIILTMSDKITLRKTTKKVKIKYKNIKIISRAEDYKDSKEIITLGANSAVPAKVEVGLQLGGVALENLDSIKHNIISIKEEIRKNNYSKIDENELFKC